MLLTSWSKLYTVAFAMQHQLGESWLVRVDELRKTDRQLEGVEASGGSRLGDRRQAGHTAKEVKSENCSYVFWRTGEHTLSITDLCHLFHPSNPGMTG